MRLVLAVVGAVGALTAVAVSAGAAPAPLPKPSFTYGGSLRGLAAAGSRIAVADYCDIRVLTLPTRTKPKSIRGLPCAEEGDESLVFDVWLGRRSLMAELLNAPSPHGEEYSLWRGTLALGRLRKLDEWGWRDDNPDDPAQGCEYAVAAGGGVLAWTRIPNRLAFEHGAPGAEAPTCLSKGPTLIALDGAARTRTRVEGSWTLLGTDAKRLVLSRLDDEGRPTGQLSVVGLDGKPLAAPRVSPATVKIANSGWLTPEGLVLATRKGLAGPGWSIRGVYAGSVAYGRVFYFRGRALHARWIRGGADRIVLTVPRGSREELVAAGSFGLAVGVQTPKEGDYVTSVYRIGWGAVDAVLPAR